jgi:hypothetical protein
VVSQHEDNVEKPKREQVSWLFHDVGRRLTLNDSHRALDDIKASIEGKKPITYAPVTSVSRVRFASNRASAVSSNSVQRSRGCRRQRFFCSVVNLIENLYFAGKSMSVRSTALCFSPSLLFRDGLRTAYGA